MLRFVTLAVCAVSLTACSTTGAPKPKSCDGHSRRPVNIYGSVLPGSPVPPTTAPVPAPPTPGPSGRPAKSPSGAAAPPPSVTGAVPKTPTAATRPTTPSPRKVSALTPTYQSCGSEGRG